MRANTFDKLSFLSLLLVTILLPIFCLPFISIPVETSKGLLLVVGLALSLIFWAIARFYDGAIILPRSLLLASGFSVVLAFFISGIASGASQASFFGTMFDVTAFWFIFTAFLFMLASSVVFRTPQKAKIVLLGTILSAAAVLVFQSLHLFFPQFLSLGILIDKTSNLFGSWNALGLFAGFSCLLFLLVIEFFPITKAIKYLLGLLVFLSILLAAAVNFPLVWVLLGMSSLIVFVYKVSINAYTSQDEIEKRNFPIFSFVVVLVTLLFFMSSGFIGGLIPNRLNLSNNEISPSISATMSVTRSVLVKQPIFGMGPNRFAEAWAMYKPANINQTLFWDNVFGSGSGLLPTLASTTGYVGILTLSLFFILFLFYGSKSIFSGIKNGKNWENFAFFLLALYLLVASFFYTTGPVIFLLALAFMGIFIGLYGAGKKDLSVSFLKDHRKSFFFMLLLFLMIIVSSALAFKYVERLASVPYFGKALAASSSEVAKLEVAQTSIGKAVGLYINDIYLRTYSQIYLWRLNSIIKKGNENLSDADKVDLQASLDQAVNGAQAATKYDPINYLNFQELGSVYQAVGSLGVKDGYSKALEAYTVASNLNPLNPGIKLNMATVSFVDGKVKEAKDYANLALTLKPDYIDALIVLSQIAKSEGDNTVALSYAQRALAISPENKDLVAYVDSLKNPSSSNTAAPSSISSPSGNSKSAPVKNQ